MIHFGCILFRFASVAVFFEPIEISVLLPDDVQMKYACRITAISHTTRILRSIRAHFLKLLRDVASRGRTCRRHRLTLNIFPSVSPPHYQDFSSSSSSALSLQRVSPAEALSSVRSSRNIWPQRVFSVSVCPLRGPVSLQAEHLLLSSSSSLWLCCSWCCCWCWLCF